VRLILREIAANQAEAELHASVGGTDENAIHQHQLPPNGPAKSYGVGTRENESTMQGLMHQNVE